VTLASGARLEPYEILSPLGAGGMGEVYRAKDTRLERIAIKVLPSHLSQSSEFRQRFEREAKTISPLPIEKLGEEVGQAPAISPYGREILYPALAPRDESGHLAFDTRLERTGGRGPRKTRPPGPL